MAIKVLAKHGPSQRSRFKSFKKELTVTSAAVRLRGCSLASSIVCLFVCLFVTDLQEPWSPSMMGILACSTDSEPQISTIQLKQMTLLHLLHYFKYFQVPHLMIHGNIWKSLQLYGRATHGCSFLSRDCRPFWTAFPVSWIQQISWILGNKNRGDRSPNFQIFILSHLLLLLYDLPFIYCSG